MMGSSILVVGPNDDGSRVGKEKRKMNLLLFPGEITPHNSLCDSRQNLEVQFVAANSSFQQVENNNAASLVSEETTRV